MSPLVLATLLMREESTFSMVMGRWNWGVVVRVSPVIQGRTVSRVFVVARDMGNWWSLIEHMSPWNLERERIFNSQDIPFMTLFGSHLVTALSHIPLLNYI